LQLESIGDVCITVQEALKLQGMQKVPKAGPKASVFDRLDALEETVSNSNTSVHTKLDQIMAMLQRQPIQPPPVHYDSDDLGHATLPDLQPTHIVQVNSHLLLPPAPPPPLINRPGRALSSSSILSPPRKKACPPQYVTGTSSVSITSQWETQALTYMSKLLHHPVQWHSPGQKSGMEAVLKRRNDLVVVLRTNSGKSMLMIIPSLLEPQKYTIGVLPLKSLMSDYARKLDEMQVPYEIYKGNKLTGNCPLVLTSPDMASLPMWTQHYGDLLKRGVSRVFFDEAHISISGSGYRPSLVNLSHFRHSQEQFILLTGTCPVQAESTLATNYLLHNHIVLRESTVRAEMEYVLYPSKAKEVVKNTVKTMVPELLLHMGPQDRILIYVPFKDLARELAKDLEGGDYTGFKADDPAWKGVAPSEARDKDTQHKETIMAQFRAGNIKVLVATSALSAGYDYSHVRHVFSIVRPDSMLDLVQELHRGGRDGKHCVAHLMPSSGQTMTRKEDPDLEGVQASWNLFYNTSSNKCLRHILSTFCDREGLTCKEIPGAYLCSGCKVNAEISELKLFPFANCSSDHNLQTEQTLGTWKNPELVMDLHSLEATTLPTNFAMAEQMAVARRSHQSAANYGKMDHLLISLQKFKSRCVHCHILGRPEEPTKHEILACPFMVDGQSVYSELSALKYKYPNYSPFTGVCYRCHVPQYPTIHPWNKQKSKEGWISCEYFDIILPACFEVWTNLQWRGQAQVAMKITWRSVQEFVAWLQNRNKGAVFTGYATNPEHLFVWWCDNCNVQ
jgi:hypothetical protein